MRIRTPKPGVREPEFRGAETARDRIAQIQIPILKLFGATAGKESEVLP